MGLFGDRRWYTKPKPKDGGKVWVGVCRECGTETHGEYEREKTAETEIRIHGMNEHGWKK